MYTTKFIVLVFLFMTLHVYIMSLLKFDYLFLLFEFLYIIT